MSLPNSSQKSEDGVLDLAGGLGVGLGLERSEERVDAFGLRHRDCSGRIAGANGRSGLLGPCAGEGKAEKRECSKSGKTNHRAKTIAQALSRSKTNARDRRWRASLFAFSGQKSAAHFS